MAPWQLDCAARRWRPRHRVLKTGASAAAGAAIQGAASSGTTTQYTVKLVDGGEVRITSEQQDMREDDCVSIAQGGQANIRRAGRIHCEQGGKDKKSEPTVQHQANADYCRKVKNRLAKAETDEAIDNAVKKVRVLCEDRPGKKPGTISAIALSCQPNAQILKTGFVPWWRD